jgi:hypothetical protein
MSIIDQKNAEQAAYKAALEAAEALPHQPPTHKLAVTVIRRDLQDNPLPVAVGNVGYDAVNKRIVLETLNAMGEVSGSVFLDIDCAKPFSEALLAITQ